MCIWWGVEFSAFIPVFPFPNPDNVREYEKRFCGGKRMEIKWKEVQYARQLESVPAVKPATPILETRINTSRSEQAPRDGTSGPPATSSDLIISATGKSSGHPTPGTRMKNLRSVVNTKPTAPLKNQDPSSRQAVSYHDQPVEKLENQLKKAKADRQRAKEVAWHEGQAESFKKQFEYHTRKAEELNAEREDQGRTPKRQRTA
ncbi:hypothetical protein ACHAPU_010541 [Fusarium lateritium]